MRTGAYRDVSDLIAKKPDLKVPPTLTICLPALAFVCPHCSHRNKENVCEEAVMLSAGLLLPEGFFLLGWVGLSCDGSNVPFGN